MCGFSPESLSQKDVFHAVCGPLARLQGYDGAWHVATISRIIGSRAVGGSDID